MSTLFVITFYGAVLLLMVASFTAGNMLAAWVNKRKVSRKEEKKI